MFVGELNVFYIKLIKELPKLDPFEGFGEDTIWFAKLIVRVKWCGRIS